jgi:DNA-binding Lrp family transcriptional regulator
LRRTDQRGGVVDPIDEKIISCVVGDARSTYAEIGAVAGLSASAAKRRLDRLVASGAVRGFTALLDPGVLSWRTEAYVEVYCRGNPTPEELRRVLLDLPEVVEACTVSGAADALLTVVVEDTAHLERVVQRLRSSRVVERTESTLVMSRLISRPRR